MQDEDQTVECGQEAMGERSTFRLVGDVDVTVADKIEERLRCALEDSPVLVDVSEVTFMDSKGLNLLIHLYKPGFLAVTRGNRIVDRLLKITGLEMLYGDVDHS